MRDESNLWRVVQDVEIPMGRQETVQLHKESAGLQNKRGSRVDTAKAKTGGSTRPKLPAGPGFMPPDGHEETGKTDPRHEGRRGKNQAGGGLDEKGGNEHQGDSQGVLFKPYSTIRDWLVKLHRRGPRGRFNKRRGRRKRALNNGILKEMRGWLSEEPKYGFKSGNWHLDMIKVTLERNRGVVCSGRTPRWALRKTHLSCRKASRTVPATRTAGRSRKGL